MQRHQRGVDLLVNVLEAADHVEVLTHDDIRRLLDEVAAVLCPILQRDAEDWMKKQARSFPKSRRTRQVTRGRP